MIPFANPMMAKPPEAGGGTAKRYWRLRFPDGSPSTSLGAAEIEFRDTVGGTDRSTTTATASSSLGSPNIPSAAFDNDNATEWYTAASGDVGSWIASDLGAPYDIAEIVFRRTVSNSADYGPTTVVVEYSDDNSTWITDTRWPTFTGLLWDAVGAGLGLGEQKIFRREETPSKISYTSLRPLATNSDSWANYTLRCTFTQAAIGGEGGNRVRFALQAGSTQGLSLTKAYIQIRSGTYGFASAPVQVLFDGGSATVAMAAGETKYSDPITIPFTTGDEIVISMHVAPSSLNDMFRSAGPHTGFAAYYKLGDDAANTSPTGYSGPFSIMPFAAVEVWTE